MSDPAKDKADLIKPAASNGGGQNRHHSQPRWGAKPKWDGVRETRRSPNSTMSPKNLLVNYVFWRAVLAGEVKP
jgi:hypothetical protein